MYARHAKVRAVVVGLVALIGLAVCLQEVVAVSPGGISATVKSADSTPPDEFDPNGKSPDEILRHFGPGVAGACLAFVDGTSVEYRKERWARGIAALWRHQPDYLVGWIIGSEKPPDAAVEEAKTQTECMIERMVLDAAKSERALVLDWKGDDERMDKDAMPKLAARFERSRWFRRRVRQNIVRSYYRDAKAQAYIWRRKFVFRKKRPFNLVTPRAAQKCDLRAGQAWNPDRRKHRVCWRETLQDEEREWEILRTSSAPGTSRHHWGTEFDLFGLSPTRFREGHQLSDEYRWMRSNAVHFGFFQPYTSTSRDEKGHGYIEERWHWSYYPVAQALFEFALEKQDVVGDALGAQWSAFESDWRRRYRTDAAFFGFIRRHWKAFMFNVDARLTHE